MAETPDRTPTSSCSVREMGSGSNLFVIEGYSVAKGIGVGKHIASDEFTMGGCKWAMYFYPDGKSPKDKSAFVSLFLSLKSEARDLPTLFELTLMDQSGKGKHMVRSCLEMSVPARLQGRGRMWGYGRFFWRARLETSDYLRDDRLKIYCTVCVVDLSIGSHIGDDWEHKDVSTDDDEAVGIDCEEWEDMAPKIPAPPDIKQDDEDEAGEEAEGGLSKFGKELRQLLRPSNRLNDSNADDEDNDDDTEGDIYPVVAPKKEAPKEEPVDSSPLKATTSAAGRGTPSASKSSKVKRKCSGEESKTPNSAPLKKAKTENELKPVKDENASSSKSGATPPSSSKSVAAPLTGPVTEDEIKAFLLQRTPVTTQDLVAKFKFRLKLKEDKDAFAATLKRIAKIEKANGLPFVVLREMI